MIDWLTSPIAMYKIEVRGRVAMHAVVTLELLFCVQVKWILLAIMHCGLVMHYVPQYSVCLKLLYHIRTAMSFLPHESFSFDVVIGGFF